MRGSGFQIKKGTSNRKTVLFQVSENFEKNAKQ